MLRDRLAGRDLRWLPFPTPAEGGCDALAAGAPAIMPLSDYPTHMQRGASARYQVDLAHGSTPLALPGMLFTHHRTYLVRLMMGYP